MAENKIKKNYNTKNYKKWKRERKFQGKIDTRAIVNFENEYDDDGEIDSH